MKEQGGEVGKGEWEGVGGVRGEVGGEEGRQRGKNHNLSSAQHHRRSRVF